MLSKTGRPGLATALVAVLALAALLSGCSGPPEEAPPPGESVTLVTDPTQGRMDGSASAHLHDYWGSSDRKTVIDAVVPVGYMTLGPQTDGVAAIVLPEPGDVVPQGAAQVEVTMTWTPDPAMGTTNQAAGTRLAVRTAADRDAQAVGPIESGVTVVVPSANERNDLPHQVLSAWEFHWVLEAVPLPGGQIAMVSFQGQLKVLVEAVRGLDIPLYPGHPDQWQGLTEFALFQAEGTAIMDGDPRTGNIRCYGSCPEIMVPGDGVVIPIDASHILVTVDRDQPMPTRLGLAYHTAISREWVMPEPVEETATSRMYWIDVLDGGDGAYTRQSNWEFALFVEEPVEDGYLLDTYRVAATVHKTT